MKEFDFNIRRAALSLHVNAESEEEAVDKARALLKANRKPDGTLPLDLKIGWEQASLDVPESAVYRGAIAKITELVEQPF